MPEAADVNGMEDDMIGSGVSMTAGRNVARALATALVMLTVLVAAMTGTAMAAAPDITITQPLTGTSTNNLNPAFGGTSNDTLDPVILGIHAGASSGGALIQTQTQLVPVEIAPGEAAWEIALETALAPGQYTAVAEQISGTEPGTSNSVTFTVDTTPPAVSINDVASPTKEAEPALTGGAGVEAGDEPSVMVTVHEGSSVSGKLVASGSAPVTGGTWSYTPTHLEDGTYTAQATQHDEAGNVGTSAAVTFRVDTTKPLVSINTVASPTKNAEPTLSGSAGVAVGDEPTVTVTIYEGASVGGTIAAAGGVTVKGGAWSYTAPHLADGTYTAQSSQSDEAGNIGTSAAVTFRVDTAAPTVSINTLASPTNDATPTLSGGDGVALGDLSAVTVAIHEGTTVSGKTVASGGATVSASTWSYTSAHLGDGTYTAQATQRDEAGNVGTSATVTFRVDTNKPLVSINAVATISKDAEPTLSGAAGVALGDEPTITVKIYAGTSVGGTPAESGSTQASNGTWSYVAPHLADGTYTAQASQSDEAGNVGTSTAVTFTIDTTAPAVTMNTIASPTKDATPTLSGSGGVATGDRPSVAVTIYEGSSVAGNIAASGSVSVKNGAWSYEAPHLNDGTYTAEASQVDEVRNVGTSAPVTFRVDTTAPVVSINALASPTNDAQPTLTGDAGVVVGDEPAVTVTIHEGGSVAGKALASGPATVSGGAWSYAPPLALAEGTYTAQASQSDEAGNVGTSVAVSFAIDTTPPKVSLTTPASGDELDVSRPTFSGLAGRAPGDEPLVTLNIYEGQTVAGKPAYSAAVTPEGENWTSNSIALPNGEYMAVAEQLDDAGNKGESNPVTFTVHTVLSLETAGFVRRLAGLFTGPTPSFDGIAAVAKEDTPSVTVRIYAGGSPSGKAVAEMDAPVSESGAWTAGPAPSLPGGGYTVQAEQASAHGKFFLSAPIAFTVDAQAPQVTLASPASGSSTASLSPTLSGSAGSAEGDLPTITVHVYAGPTTAGALVETVTTQASGGSWSSAVGALSPGTYTVQAEQSDDVGNQGHSEAVTLTVTQFIAAASEPSLPVASFKWIPGAPNTGEPVTLISTSTDASAPITGFEWALAGNSLFTQGESSLTTSFSTPGPHVVQLRVTDASGRSSVVAETIPVSTAPVPLMQPFPVVRMAGSYNASGAKISVLAVLAPVGAKVAITCRGPHCPAKSLALLAAAGAKNKAGTTLITFRRFERSLRAGVVLEIWVSKHGEIGKFTRFTIRRGKSPSRVDECLNPAGTTPIVCPS
jgi:large repetitive protein